MTDHILAAYRADINMRLYGSEPRDDTGHRVVVEEIEPGVVFQDHRVKVTAIDVPHGTWPVAFGFKFETADRSIVISGDTTPSEAIVDACQGCDILVHEVYSSEKFESRPPAWKNYHAKNHTSTLELARLANQARPKLLVLYHQLPWGATPEEMLAEIRSAYEGPVVWGEDLDVY